VLALGTDVSKEEEVESTVQQTLNRFGKMDVCINGAGIGGMGGPTAELNSEVMDRVLDVNLKGVWYCERAEIRQMIKQEERAVA
jgi:NAD(P)-dependent dehydrogenase (short-subunit alcohol dehydrogenase family)